MTSLRPMMVEDLLHFNAAELLLSGMLAVM